MRPELHITKIVVSPPGISMVFEITTQAGLSVCEFIPRNIAFNCLEQRIDIFGPWFLDIDSCLLGCRKGKNRWNGDVDRCAGGKKGNQAGTPKREVLP